MKPPLPFDKAAPRISHTKPMKLWGMRRRQSNYAIALDYPDSAKWLSINGVILNNKRVHGWIADKEEAQSDIAGRDGDLNGATSSGIPLWAGVFPPSLAALD
jgi:hypothetical protein